jgi:hypothetical protein
MTREGQYTSRSEILAAIDKIRRQTKAIRQGVEENQARFQRLHRALMTAIHSMTTVGGEFDAAVVILEDQHLDLNRFIGIINVLRLGFETDVLSTTRMALDDRRAIELELTGIPDHLVIEFKRAMDAFVQRLESFGRGIIVEQQRATGPEKRSLRNLWGLLGRKKAQEAVLIRRGDDFYFEAKKTDTAAVQLIDVAEAAYSAFVQSILELIESRILYGLQPEAKQVESQLLGLLKTLFTDLRNLALAETRDPELVDTVFAGREPKPDSEKLVLPIGILSYEIEPGRKSVLRTEIRRHSEKRKIWFKQRQVVVEDLCSVNYLACRFPSPLGIIRNLEKSFSGAIDVIVVSISQWILKTLVEFSEELKIAAEDSQRALLETLEVRLAQDLSTWDTSRNYWGQFHQVVTLCASLCAGLQHFQDLDAALCAPNEFITKSS